MVSERPQVVSQVCVDRYSDGVDEVRVCEPMRLSLVRSRHGRRYALLPSGGACASEVEADDRFRCGGEGLLCLLGESLHRLSVILEHDAPFRLQGRCHLPGAEMVGAGADSIVVHCEYCADGRGKFGGCDEPRRVGYDGAGRHRGISDQWSQGGVSRLALTIWRYRPNSESV